MLRALQADVDAWPAAVKAAGVKNASRFRLPPGGPQQRGPAHAGRPAGDLSTTWSARGRTLTRSTPRPAGPRIITQAGPELTWEWLMVDETKPYAPLFPDELRARVRAALEADESTTEWNRLVAERTAADTAQNERIQQMMDDMRSGKRSRPAI